MALEVHRLLLGPWIGPGSTEFARTTLKFSPYRALTAEGEWVSLNKKDIVLLLKITHATDRYGNIRHAYLAFESLGVNEDVLGLEEFRVWLVRPPST